MPVTRLVARPLLAAPFITGGIDTLRNPAPRAKLAEPVTSTIAEVTPLPDDTDLLVRVNAAVQIGAGALLAIGKAPRLSAALLAGSLVPTTLAGHRFWEETDAAKRKQQQVHFVKNAALVGALILATFDTEGAPSLTWRANKLRQRVVTVTPRQTRKARRAAHRHEADQIREGATAGAAAVREGASAARDLASHGAVAALGAAGALATAARDSGLPAARHAAAAARETGLPAARHAARHTVAAARETGLPAARHAAAAIRELPVRETVEHLAELAREAVPA